MPTYLSNSILKTITYFDMLDFAPTLLELQRWLIKSESDGKQFSLFELLMTLEAMAGLHQLKFKQGVYFFPGREELVTLRQKKYIYFEQKLKCSRFYLRLLAMMPYVRAIWLANTMGWGNPHKKSDLDLFIVTESKKIWTARFFSTALLKILRQRPGEQLPEKAICLSMYVDEDHLNLERYKISDEDIHFTFWVNQMYPVYDSQASNPNEGIMQKFQSENQWIRSAFLHSHWTKSINRTHLRLIFFERGVKHLLEFIPGEKFFKKIQLYIMPKKLKTLAADKHNTNVVLSDEIIKLHDNDSREIFQKKWEGRVKDIIPSSYKV